MNRLSEYFNLTKKEQRGVFLLITLIFLLLLSHIFLPLFYPSHDLQVSLLKFPEVTDSIPMDLEPRVQSVSKPIHPRKLFTFNPNTLGKEGWEKLGLSSKQAQIILNYRNKGGKFYKREDLKKIYSLNEEKLQELLPFVEIPVESKPAIPVEKRVFENKSYVKKKNRVLEINSSDSLAFMELEGIGPAFSKRIIKFREVLGGFVHVEQIAEVYGLPEETYLKILPFLELDKSLVKRLNINTISFKDLDKHPYVNYKQARTIVNYRDQHGPYKSISDLRNIHSLDENFFRKIELYLDYR